MAAEKSYSRVEVGANISRARNSPPQIHVSLVAAYIIYCTSLERQVSRGELPRLVLQARPNQPQGGLLLVSRVEMLKAICAEWDWWFWLARLPPR